MRARRLRVVAPVAVMFLAAALTMSGLRAPTQRVIDTSVSAVEVAPGGGAALQPGRIRAAAAKHKGTPYTPPLFGVLGLALAGVGALLALALAATTSAHVAGRSWRLVPSRAPPLSAA